MPDVSTPAGAPGSLSPLTLSASTGVAGQPFTASITGKTSGSTLKLIDGAGGVFTLSGTTISAPAGVLPGQYPLEVIETFPGAFGSPKANLLGVTVTPMTLSALSPSASSGTAGTAFAATLSGMQSGSQLAILRAPAGYSLSGGVLSRAQGPSPGGDVVVIREINPLAAHAQGLVLSAPSTYSDAQAVAAARAAGMVPSDGGTPASTAQLAAAIPAPCATTPAADTLNGTVGSAAPCTPRADRSRLQADSSKATLH